MFTFRQVRSHLVVIVYCLISMTYISCSSSEKSLDDVLAADCCDLDAGDVMSDGNWVDGSDQLSEDSSVEGDIEGQDGTIPADSVRFVAPPVEGASLSAHPLIRNGRLFLYWTSGGFSLGPQWLAAYDLEDDLELVWQTQLTPQGLFLAGGDSGITNLMVTDNRIPMVYMDALGDLHFVEVHERSGAVVLDREVPDKWFYIDPKGRERSKSVIEPTGAVMELGDDLFFSEGTTLDKCSGAVHWSSYGSVMGSLFNGDAIVVRRQAYGWEPGGGLGVKVWDLSVAYEVLTGYAEEDSAFLFETDAGNTQGIAYTTNDFVLYGGEIWKGRSYPDGGDGIDPGSLFVEAYDARTGAFQRRVELDLPLDTAELVGIQWNDVALLGHIAVVDGRLLIPFRAFTVSEPRGFMLLAAVDLQKGEQAWATTYQGQHSTLIPTADAVYVLETHLNANFDYSGFSILKLDLGTGHRMATMDSSEIHEGGRWSPLVVPGDDGTLMLEYQPLLVEGKLYLPLHSPSGSTLAVVSVGTSETGPMQYKYNNQLNPVFNLADPLSNQAGDPLPAEPHEGEDTGTSDEDLLVDETTPDESVEPLPENIMNQGILDSLGLTAEALAVLPVTYTALLSSVTYSNSGEEDVSNMGEGYLRVRGRFGCSKTQMRYPWKGFVPLVHNPFESFGVEGETYLSFQPDFPLAWRPLVEMQGSNSGLHLSYSALEDDEMGLLDTIVSYVGKAIAIVEAWTVGDFCTIAEVVSSTIAAEANDYTQHFGAPFMELFEGTENTPPTVFGIPQGERWASYSFAASASRGILVAAKEAIGAACAITDVVQGDLSALDDAIGSTLDVFSPDEDSTQGSMTLRRALALPVESFSVTLNRVEILGVAGEGVLDADFRIGLLSTDALSDDPEGAVSTEDTPFRSYVKYSSVPLVNDLSQDHLLYEVELSPQDEPSGSAGFYLELDLQSVQLGIARIAFWSQTRFFEDLLYGSWEQDATHAEQFRQTIKTKFRSPMMEGYLTWTFEVTLGF